MKPVPSTCGELGPGQLAAAGGPSRCSRRANGRRQGSCVGVAGSPREAGIGAHYGGRPASATAAGTAGRGRPRGRGARGPLAGRGCGRWLPEAVGWESVFRERGTLSYFLGLRSRDILVAVRPGEKTSLLSTHLESRMGTQNQGAWPCPPPPRPLRRRRECAHDVGLHTARVSLGSTVRIGVSPPPPLCTPSGSGDAGMWGILGAEGLERCVWGPPTRCQEHRPQS